jgi:hypothetical protein
VTNGTWREIAAPIIAEVISCFGRERIGTDVDLAYVKKAISATYPFGERKYWPYKVWCDEVRRQLRLKTHTPDERQGVLPL